MFELDKLERRLTKLEKASSNDTVTYTMKDGGQVTLTFKQLASEYDIFVCWVMANADPEIAASDGSKLHTLQQCVAPAVESEAEFDKLPYWMQNDVALSYVSDRSQWPDWLSERYKYRPNETLTGSLKHFEDWPAYKARIEAIAV